MPAMLRRSIPCLALLVGLAVPASAAATTFTVDPSAAAGCADTVCRTILDANAAVADGDTVQIKDGTYSEAGPIVVTKKNVTFQGTPGKVGITQTDGKNDTPVFKLGEGTVLDGLAIAVQPGGAQAVLATAQGAAVRRTTLLRTGDNATDAAVVGTTAPSGRLTLDTVVVAQAPSATGAVRAPAVASNATSSIALTDSIVVTGAGTGPALLLTGADPALKHTLVRTQLVVGEAASNAVTMSSTDTQGTPQDLVIDSSLLVPGPQGVGIAASNTASLTGAAAAITITGLRATIAGGKQPLALSAGASSLGLNIADPVTATFDRSILHGAAPSTATTNRNLLQQASTSTISIQNSDTTDAGGTGVALSGTQTTADAALFADAAKRNYHLRVGSPAIDKGGAVGAADSQKDIDQQPRVVGAASDLGADEFVSLPPVAKVTASSTAARENEAVTFDGSASSDPDAGGAVAAYRWDFGDGLSAETSTPTTTHAYAKAGTYTPKLTVVDAEGTPSQPVAAPPITVTEATPPTIRITTPANKKTLRVFTVKRTKIKSGKDKGKVRTTRTRNRFYFRGSAADASGVAKVELSIQRTALAKKAAAACVYLDGKTSFTSKNCKNPLFFPVRLDSDGFWVYRTKAGVRFRAGTYRVSARATDKNGVTSAPVSITVTLK